MATLRMKQEIQQFNEIFIYLSRFITKSFHHVPPFYIELEITQKYVKGHYDTQSVIHSTNHQMYHKKTKHSNTH